MKQSIEISELWCEAIIGIYPHEREQKQPLGISAQLTIDASAAIAEDSIARTLDYEAIAIALKEHTEQHHYQLLETLLAKLLELLQSHTSIISAQLTIRKPQALAHLGATVAISGGFKRD